MSIQISGGQVTEVGINSGAAPAGQALTADGAGGATWEEGIQVLDEDNMASNSAVAVPTQQSVKAYVDSQNFVGVTWNESTDAYARTGKAAGVAVGGSAGNALLPIQAKMKRCVINDAGVVQYYLDPADSTKKMSGSASVLTGADGQVMVEIPAFWLRYAYAGTTHQWDISDLPLPGFTIHPAFVKNGVQVNFRYVGAYEAVLYDVSASIYANGIHQTAFSCTFANADSSITAGSRTAPFKSLAVGDKLTISGTASNNATFTVASIVSDVKITTSEALVNETAASTVVGTQKDWTATTGDKLASVSGKKPITQGTRANFRAAAKNRGTGWRQFDFYLRSAIQLLYLVEYASFYSQSMIGAGITNVGDWPAYNDYNPITVTGASNGIGNATGNTGGGTTGAGEVGKYLSYRGVENWFGHLWEFVDGFNVNSNVPYVHNTDTQFADDTATSYTDLGLVLHNADGYPATISQIGTGFLPESVGASTTTKLTDYYYQAAGWLVALVGGSATDGVNAGGFCWYLAHSSGYAYRYVGGRLCI